MNRWLVAVILMLTSIVSHGARAQTVTTVITHGYSTDGSKGAWIEGMADAIIARAGGGGAVCRYEQTSGAWVLVSGALDSGQPVCLIYRWLEDFSKPGSSWGYAEAAADALYAALCDPVFADSLGTPLIGFDLIDERFLHLLGHSRGTVVNSEVVERFAVAGINVDHVTTFDPHPVNGTLDPPISPDWGDPTPRRWTNITFHDNYWRADGGWLNALDPDGMPIPDALNVELDESALNCCAYANAHSDVHLWYHGTIDTSPTPCDGEECINATMRSTWWPDGYTEVGYYYSRVGGGVGQRPAQGPGEPPGTVPTIAGGDFAQGSHAGWRFHGGAMNGTLVNDGRWYLRLSAADGTNAIHNRFYLPPGASAVMLSYRVLSPDTNGLDDVARLRLIDRAGGVTDLSETIDLAQPDSGWIESAMFIVPAGVDRGQAYRLEVELDGGAQLDASVGLDDFALHIVDCPADLTGDAAVDVGDLLDMLAAWGPNPGHPADLNADGTVNVADLLLLLTAWGPC